MVDTGRVPLPICSRAGHLPPAGDVLRVSTWNVGYAGLGANADFLADGGRRVVARSRDEVQSNLRGICHFLENETFDLLLLQEVALPSRLTHKTDVRGAIDEALHDCNSVFSPMVATRRIPMIGSITVGNAVYSRREMKSSWRVGLPESRGRTLGVLRQHFNAIEVRLPVEGSSREWVVLDIHLAVFDKNGELRDRQLGRIRSYILSQYAEGHYVVVGGDWNHRLVETSFPHSTPARHLVWLRDLPASFTPEGWKWAVDANCPSNRTLHKPFVRGENYTSVIDGYVVSPNLQIHEVSGTDLGFACSDHQPVRVELSRL